MLEQNNNDFTSVTTPLKPMGFGEMLDTTFGLYRKHLTLFLRLIAFSVFGELTLHLLIDFSDFFFSRYLLLGIGTVIFSVTFSIIGIGGIAIGTGATYLGEEITIRSILQRTIQRFWRLLGSLLLWSLVVGFLTFTIIGIPFAIYFAVRWGLTPWTSHVGKACDKHMPLRRSSELVKVRHGGRCLECYLRSFCLAHLFTQY